MGQTFRAICPAATVLHVFELVSENGRTVGWCTKCRRTWPLSELSDQAGDDAPPSPRGGKRKKKPGKSVPQ